MPMVIVQLSAEVLREIRKPWILLEEYGTFYRRCDLFDAQLTVLEH